METETKDYDTAKEKASSGSEKTKGAMNIEGYPVKGLSIAGHETCIMFPTLKLAFDIGRCPQHAIYHDFLCISHAHMDHIVCPFCAFLDFVFVFVAVGTGNGTVSFLFSMRMFLLHHMDSIVHTFCILGFLFTSCCYLS
jgi:hypothetical protein